MKIFKTDDKITVLAKQAAMICEYAIHSPLHVTFEDGNYNYDTPMDFERRYNEKYREVNGELMYQFVQQFLDEFDKLDKEERKACYRLFRKKWDYLGNKWLLKIRKNSKPYDHKTEGLAWKHYLAEDGHIYVETFLGVKLKQF